MVSEPADSYRPELLHSRPFLRQPSLLDHLHRDGIRAILLVSWYCTENQVSFISKNAEHRPEYAQQGKTVRVSELGYVLH